MVYRLLSKVFFLAGLGLIALAAYDYFAPAARPALEVAPTEVAVLDLAAGQKTAVVFRLDNRSGRPLRVLGLAGC